MEKKIYIFGAHSRGRTFREYVTFLYPDTSMGAYLVDDLAENESWVDGIKEEVLKEARGVSED